MWKTRKKLKGRENFIVRDNFYEATAAKHNFNVQDIAYNNFVGDCSGILDIRRDDADET